MEPTAIRLQKMRKLSGLESCGAPVDATPSDSTVALDGTSNMTRKTLTLKIVPGYGRSMLHHFRKLNSMSRYHVGTFLAVRKRRILSTSIEQKEMAGRVWNTRLDCSEIITRECGYRGHQHRLLVSVTIGVYCTWKFLVSGQFVGV